jgi:6-pyruvoyltetrahydropterin/6-carboxytetrahydropterin synthase
MSFEITVGREFSAAHQLRLYDGTLESIHGHNWRVRITVASPKLDPIGTVMDFHQLEHLVDAIIAPLHNRHLNEVPPFSQGLNPSAENVAFHIGHSLKLPAGVRLLSSEVCETENCRAIYRPD